MITETTFGVFGMSCGHCQRKVEQDVKNLDGISDIQVDLKREQITVTFNSNLVDETKIKEAVKKAGYRPE